MAEIKENNIIDLGSVEVPTRWEDISLLKYEAIERFYEDKDKKFNVIDVLDIIIDKDKDYIMNLPAEFVEIILNKLQFLLTLPKEEKPVNKITIDGEEYIINFQNKLKTGEFLAAETILKDDKHNYAALLAILCRKPDEIYDSKFENEVVEERVKLFEKQPITKILPIIGFFMNCYIVSNLPTQLSLNIKEEINHIRKHIETLRKSGKLSMFYTKWLTRKLLKLEKSINSI